VLPVLSGADVEVYGEARSNDFFLESCCVVFPVHFSAGDAELEVFLVFGTCIAEGCHECAGGLGIGVN